MEPGGTPASAEEAGAEAPAYVPVSSEPPAPDAERLRRETAVLECDVRDELLVYLPHADAAVALNVSARAVWSLCGHESSIAEIAAALGTRYGVPAEWLLPDVRDAVASLRAHGLLVAAVP